MKYILKIIAVVLFTVSGLLLYGSAYATIASRFEGRTFWDLERSFGGFTIHLAKNVSMDILWFQVVPFLLFMAAWAMLLLKVLDAIGKK